MLLLTLHVRPSVQSFTQRSPISNREREVVCVQVLSGMPTTTKQDQQALAHAQTLDTFRGRCLQLVLKWRIQYKQSLARACKTAQMSLAALKEV